MTLSHVIILRYTTPRTRDRNRLADFVIFAGSHGRARKKGAGHGLSPWPPTIRDKPELVEAMADLAVREMSHYGEVVKAQFIRAAELDRRRERDPLCQSTCASTRARGSEAISSDVCFWAASSRRAAQRKASADADAASDEPIQAILHLHQPLGKKTPSHPVLPIRLPLFSCQRRSTARLGNWLDIEAEIAPVSPAHCGTCINASTDTSLATPKSKASLTQSLAAVLLTGM